MIKVILFDCDGVIIKEQEKYFSQRLIETGVNIDNELVRAFFKKEFLLCEIGKLDLKEELAKRIQPWGYVGSVDELIKYWFEGESELVLPMMEEVKKLQKQGIKCFVVTNNEKYRTAYLWNTGGLKKIFDGMFSSADLGFLKNDTRFWQRVYKSLTDFKPTEVLAIDNKREMLNKAAEVGFRTYFYTTFSNFKIQIDKYSNTR